MHIGIIGLGRMGGNISQRLMNHGHSTVVFDTNAAAVDALAAKGAVPATSIADMVDKLQAPRTVWIMLPAGTITETTITEVARHMQPGDIIIDGGNTMYKDDIRRAGELKAHGITYIDVGTSGGVWGLERGYCMMIGGEKQAVDHLDPIFKALAPGLGNVPRTPGREGRNPTAEEGYLHCGPAGSGHFVKMIHNGIEYGMMQAFAEGFNVMKHKNSPALPEDMRFDLNMGDIAEVWRRGSVVSSWLLDLTAQALATDENLDAFSSSVSDSGEGRWTVDAAVEQGVPIPVLAASLWARFSSRSLSTYGDKMLSAMRFGFGGHLEKKA
ncbi:MAG: decarboxylating 6-phosphogluconate dehydrogenase [Pseudomonas fluorescens]|nr:MAG: decarboxylating 6-phosphogluconate dehydrogenase [Pseudomonas fluorescens]